MRDHLFVSYAGEDAVLARWVTLKLTSEGYRVWCDQFKLLGGESYPEDIDDAIKNKTLRMVALLSRHSIHKPNPRKERTLALNLGKERRVDFVIPLNVDGLSPTELDWMTGDITFVPFHKNWAEGLAQLLKKLRGIDAPRALASDGPRIAAETFLDDGGVLSRAAEVLYSNELRFYRVPEAIHRFTAATPVGKHVLEELAMRWPFYRAGDRTFLAFRSPPAKLPGDLRVSRAGGSAWPYTEMINGIPTRNIVTHLLKRSLIHHCVERGLKPVPGRPEACYFPASLLPHDKIRFQTYTGRTTTALAVGKRSIRRRRGEKKKEYRYHLACMFRVFRDGEGFKVQIRLRLHLTDESGTPVPARFVPSRRKRVTRGWWNHEWLSRYLAVCSFLADGEETITIGEDAESHVVVDAKLAQVSVPVGIDESRLGPVKVPDAVAMEEETEDGNAPDLLPPTDEPEGEQPWAR